MEMEMEMEMEMDAAVAVSTIATTELNDQRKSASHQSLGSALNKGCAIFDSKHVVGSPPSSSSAFLELVRNDACGTCLGPITPDSNRDHFESTSPLSLSSSPNHKDDRLYSFNEDSSPCTPGKDVFDPFVPGPDNLMLAPYCRKYVEESHISVARRLKFESSSKFATSNDSETETHDKKTISASEEESLFEAAVYMTILEAIISIQTKDIAAKVSDVLPNSDGFKTPPPAAPHLSGVADTCPRAPVKPTNKFRSIDKEICTRLEF